MEIVSFRVTKGIVHDSKKLGPVPLLEPPESCQVISYDDTCFFTE